MNRRSIMKAMVCLAAALLGSSQSRAEEDARSFVNLQAAQLAEMLQKRDFLFVNVHVPYEGEIEKTDVFIPFDRIEENLGRFPDDKRAKIILYCRSGRMSAIAARSLVEHGYTNVSHLSGGMVEWQRKGYRIRK